MDKEVFHVVGLKAGAGVLSAFVTTVAEELPPNLPISM
jgi:hypothetical protein